MPTQTPNYNLTKPLKTENYNIDVFNNNADIIDTALKNIDSQMNEITNQNLLINGDFQVWQRGESFTGTNIYTSDRWIIRGGDPSIKINKVNNHLKITNTNKIQTMISQMIDNVDYLLGKQITLTLKTTSKKYTCSGILSTDFIQSSPGSIPNLYCNYDSKKKICTVEYVDTSDVEIEWVKLELGSTPTPFIPKLYSQELADCQRYYGKFRLRGDYIGNENKHYYGYSSVVRPRIVPTISIEQADIAGTLITDKVSLFDNDIYGFSVLSNAVAGSAGDHYRFQLIGSYDAEIY